jgi:hypothetical protein
VGGNEEEEEEEMRLFSDKCLPRFHTHHLTTVISGQILLSKIKKPQTGEAMTLIPFSSRWNLSRQGLLLHYKTHIAFQLIVRTRKGQQSPHSRCPFDFDFAIVTSLPLPCPIK